MRLCVLFIVVWTCYGANRLYDIADYVTNDCNTVDPHVLKYLLHRDQDHPTGLEEFIREWREAGEKPPKRFRKSVERRYSRTTNVKKKVRLAVVSARWVL
ncbi:hypothetical protein RvY_10316 [Ramazzottius varieornatus]|uniref:Uncharacterized protein n=1 Tax=Ramazzottius varieornatus TaxID=947166 RepID=A0A1D1VEG8_RAMVA|nr:hypothetical protein RvY_10316 [Ramazzottius varieornatus]